MPMIQFVVDTDEYKELKRVKDKHGHTWRECLQIYADIYDKCEPRSKKHVNS